MTKPFTAAPRLAGWQGRVEAVLDSRMRDAFRWGERDCAALALAGIAALIGRDAVAAAGLPDPRWGDEPAAREALSGTGFSDLAALADSLAYRIHPAHARLYDLALLPVSGSGAGGDVFGGAFGFFNGATVLCVTPRGIAGRPRGDAFAAWSIGADAPGQGEV